MNVIAYSEALAQGIILDEGEFENGIGVDVEAPESPLWAVIETTEEDY